MAARIESRVDGEGAGAGIVWEPYMRFGGGPYGQDLAGQPLSGSSTVSGEMNKHRDGCIQGPGWYRALVG